MRSAFSPCPSSLPASLSWRHGSWCSQQMSCIARAKLFACDLGPIVYTHEGQEYLLGLNGRKGRGPVAEAGLLSVVRKELLQAVLYEEPRAPLEHTSLKLYGEPQAPLEPKKLLKGI